MQTATNVTEFHFLNWYIYNIVSRGWGTGVNLPHSFIGTESETYRRSRISRWNSPTKPLLSSPLSPGTVFTLVVSSSLSSYIYSPVFIVRVASWCSVCHVVTKRAVCVAGTARGGASARGMSQQIRRRRLRVRTAWLTADLINSVRRQSCLANGAATTGSWVLVPCYARGGTKSVPAKAYNLIAASRVPLTNIRLSNLSKTTNC